MYDQVVVNSEGKYRNDNNDDDEGRKICWKKVISVVHKVPLV